MRRQVKTQPVRPNLYFGYGSCMDYQGRITEHGYAGKFHKIGIARLESYRFCMNKITKENMVVANLTADPEGSVFGVLYQIDPGAEEYLDEREGVHRGQYWKDRVSVWIHETVYHHVLVYIANPQFVTDRLLPVSKTYELELKRGGAELPEPYRLEFLQEIEKCARIRLIQKPF